MRTPSKSPSAIEKRTEDKRITQVRRYKVITPLFGGGVDPAKADPVTVVRATEIRGHLRFWWRATRGGQFEGNLDKMREAEAKIWGSAANEKGGGPSKVQISITKSPALDRLPTIETVTIRRHGRNVQVPVGAPESPYSYVAFPLRKTDDKPAGKLLKSNFEFTVRVDIDATKDVLINLNGGSKKLDLRKEVEAALWAWETFGGIGARTRRGFGALQLLQINNTIITPPEDNDDIVIQITTGLATHITNGPWPEQTPHLNHNLSFVVTQCMSSADEAWLHLIKTLRDFRQDRRLKNGRPYGRSKWPEPDEIRRLTKTFAKDDTKDHHPTHPVRKFPRGRFGLPIIFQFKASDVRIGDPNPSTLLGGNGQERYASRLIMRPISCVRSSAAGIACILNGPDDPPGGYILEVKIDNSVTGTSSQIFSVKADITDVEARQIPILNGNPDVLQAFLDTL